MVPRDQVMGTPIVPFAQKLPQTMMELGFVVLPLLNVKRRVNHSGLIDWFRNLDAADDEASQTKFICSIS